MTLFFLALIRVIVLGLSYFLSTFTATLFFTFALFLGADASWLQEDAGVVVGSIGFAASVWFVMAQLAFLPAVVIMGLMEFARLSSLLMNTFAGGICALAVKLMLEPNDVTEALPYESHEIWIASIASGFVGGLTHWLLAGHRAGRWLGSEKTTNQAEHQ